MCRDGRRRSIWASGGLVLVLALAAAGCVDVDARIDAAGGGTLRIRYVLDAGVTPAAELAAWRTPGVEPTGFVLETVKLASVPEPVRLPVATIALRVADATRLAEVERFRNVAITRTREGPVTQLRILFRNPHPQEVDDDGREGPRLALTLPGTVYAVSPPPVEREEQRVVWRLSLADLQRGVELVVAFATPGTGPCDPAGRPPAT